MELTFFPDGVLVSYTADDTLTANLTFAGRIRMASVRAAEQILAETPNPKANVERKRQALAVSVIQNPTMNLNSFVHATLEYAGISSLTSTSLDSDIDTAISAIWNDVAGVVFGD